MQRSAVLLVAALILGAACRSTTPRPPGTPGGTTIDFGLSLSSPGLDVPPPGNPVDISGVTGGALASATLLAKNETSARVRFRCADGTEHTVDIPIGGGPVDTGCKFQGKRVRVNVKP